MFGSHGSPSAWLVALCAAGLACTTLPAPVTEEGSANVDRILYGERSKDALTSFAGVSPAICVTSSATTELCEWHLGSRHAGWAALAATIDSTDRLNLICELPSDGTPRASGSCNAYPRRSNRGRFPIPSASTPRNRRGQETPSQARARYERQTKQELAAATTLPELARLVGAAPNECSPHSSGIQLCVWRATARTYGHGTLAMSIGASKQKRVRMRCRLPMDGSERAPDSCSVEVGG